MTRDDWRRRYYAPLPGNVVYVKVDHRDEALADVFVKVMDLHSFGQFLYHDVIAHSNGKPFDGTPEWFRRAIEGGWIPRPNKPFPVVQIRQALLVYNLHTRAMFEHWSRNRKAVISLGSYLAFMKRHAPIELLGHWSLCISRVPITDPYTREAMIARRVTKRA